MEASALGLSYVNVLFFRGGWNHSLGLAGIRAVERSVIDLVDAAGFLAVTDAIAVRATVSGESPAAGPNLREQLSSRRVAPNRSMRVQMSRHSHQRGTVCSDVVFVGAELASLGRDAFQFFLALGVCVSDVHDETLISNGGTVVLSNDLLADITRLKSTMMSEWQRRTRGAERD